MSFSGKVKEELSKETPMPVHCCVAETAAVIGMCGRIYVDEEGKTSLKIRTENVTAARKYFTLLKKTYNINTKIAIQRMAGLNKNKIYVLTISDDEIVRQMLTTTHLSEDLTSADDSVFRRECCKRAFIRGAFLAAGSVSDPIKAYHFEIVCTSEAKAEQLRRVMQHFKIEARIIKRKKYDVVYVKDSSQVVDLLNIMGAHHALMDMENVRIVKDMRNQVNRKVNCETANINKTVSAAMKQIEDIQLIRDSGMFHELPEALREMAVLRVEYPEATLTELGQMLNEPVGKSGVNHRLKKISLMAETLRDTPK